MELTRDGDYAVRVLVELARRPPGEVVRTAELSRATSVPRAYLGKIVQVLSRASLVGTRQGAGGGVSLVKDAGAITLRQMVEAVEGPIFLSRCLVRSDECPRERICPVHPVWARIRVVLLHELESVTAKDLAEAGRPPRHRADAARPEAPPDASQRRRGHA